MGLSSGFDAPLSAQRYFRTRNMVMVMAATTTNLWRLMKPRAMRLLGPATDCGAVKAA